MRHFGISSYARKVASARDNEKHDAMNAQTKNRNGVLLQTMLVVVSAAAQSKPRVVRVTGRL